MKAVLTLLFLSSKIYATTQSDSTATKKVIGPQFIIEMIEKIVFSYRFDKILTNIEEHIADCLSYLVIIAHNYNSNKKSKAFSYFSVIVRNYFFNVVKKSVNKSFLLLVSLAYSCNISSS